MMNLPLQAIEKVIEQPPSFIRERANLNLPHCETNFPFRPRQREAIELALSNCPVAIIAGIPGSGKTEITKAVVNTAIKHQRSILIIAPLQSTLEQYQNLPIITLEATTELEYRQRVKDWLKEKLQNPQINFTPVYSFPDILFDSLQPDKWLDLIQQNNEKNLTQEVKKTFPDISDARCFLLVKQLQKSTNLLAQRERLKQDYQRLSEPALEELTTVTLNSVNFPVVCLSQRLNLLPGKSFDLVIVEDSHYLEQATIKTIAKSSKKLVLLGEIWRDSNYFLKKLFNHLSPAYRIEIKENHRLHPDLATKIIPSLYHYYPYTPINYAFLPSDTQEPNRLIWHDVVNFQQLIIILSQYLQQNPDSELLTFSASSCQKIQQKLANYQITYQIKSIENWHGKECSNLLIICDKNDSKQPNKQDIQLALTRAKNTITILGDKTYYEKSIFSPFFEQNLFHLKRDLTLIKQEEI